ncbi:MAG: AAA-like domain-containing protein [Cyanobacteria bacterium P01_D01_bin.36]
MILRNVQSRKTFGLMTNPVKKILFLAANPAGTTRTRLDEEAREIQQGLERSKWRDRFELVPRWAVGVEDLRRSLLDIEPQIVHFSGLGSDVGGLVLHSNSAQAESKDLDGRDSTGEALANLLGLFSPGIECVLLNACYSERQATAIHRHVDYVIGMNQAVGDRIAISFAVGFYDALGAGRPYENAYRFGCSAIAFEDMVQRLTPVLMTRKSAGEVEPVKAVDEGPAVGSEVPEATGVVLENPEGQVPLRSPFYIDRPPIEADCMAEIEKLGALIRIKAARQMGKSSLMSRILAHGSQQGYCSVPIYFQEADGEVFEDLSQFLQWFCAIVAEELALEIPIDEIWRSSALGNKRKCTNFFQKYVLPQIKQPLVLGLDEVDLVFQHLKIAQDFFALLRTWHERGKNQATWQNLRLVIVHSREVYIPLDMHQSPFNVGMPVELPEFSAQQVMDLAQRHGLALSADDVTSLQAMVGGHPYLVRVALSAIARGRLSLARFLQVAPTEEGPYEDHLRRHLANLHRDERLVKAVEEMLRSAGAVAIGTDEAFQLDSMGLVKRQGNAAAPLCDLYRQYFGERL